MKSVVVSLVLVTFATLLTAVSSASAQVPGGSPAQGASAEPAKVAAKTKKPAKKTKKSAAGKKAKKSAAKKK